MVLLHQGLEEIPKRSMQISIRRWVIWHGSDAELAGTMESVAIFWSAEIDSTPRIGWSLKPCVTIVTFCTMMVHGMVMDSISR